MLQSGGARRPLSAQTVVTPHPPKAVGYPGSLIAELRQEAGDAGCAFVGFDFPIGVPAHYAARAGISNFRAVLPNLGTGEWEDFYSVCDQPEQISVHRPFYPNGAYKGRRKEDLFRALNAVSMEPLLRQCERGCDGQKQACCLFWTLGGNQVGKAAISGWRDVFAPALRNGDPVSLWPFDGALVSLIKPGRVVIAETYPAECYRWFSDERLRKQKAEDRKKFGESLLLWAERHSVALDDDLRNAIRDGFPHGGDDAFDAVVGLFGMLQIVLGQRAPGEPGDGAIREVEGWTKAERKWIHLACW